MKHTQEINGNPSWEPEVSIHSLKQKHASPIMWMGPYSRASCKVVRHCKDETLLTTRVHFKMPYVRDILSDLPGVWTGAGHCHIGPMVS